MNFIFFYYDVNNRVLNIFGNDFSFMISLLSIFCDGRSFMIGLLSCGDDERLFYLGICIVEGRIYY